MTNRGVSKDNFEIMGQSTTTREFTLRNKNSGMITTRHVREILLKASSLKDPNQLDIGETINLQVDELPSPEIDKDFKPDMESFENIGTEELNIEEFDSEDDMSPVDNWYPQQTESKKDIHQEKKIKPDSDVESELKLLSVDSSDDVNVVDLSKEKNDDDDNSKLKQIS